MAKRVAGGTKKKAVAAVRLDVDNPLGTLRQVAKSRGGACLARRYVNARTALPWRCSLGHRWEAAPDNVLRGRWCPICNLPPRDRIEDMQAIALERGGLCLSRSYRTAKAKLRWACADGHRFSATADSIKTGSWCPICARGKPVTLRDMQHIARERGGRCASVRYVNDGTKLLWCCKQGHTWKATPNFIKRGTWCPRCAREANKGIKRPVYDVDFLHGLAAAKQGRCHAIRYEGIHHRYEWQCEQGHRWWTSAHSVRRGTWCASCWAESKATKPSRRVPRGTPERRKRLPSTGSTSS